MLGNARAGASFVSIPQQHLLYSIFEVEELN